MAVPEVDGERPKACFSRGAAEKLALRPATTSAAVQPDCSTQNSQMIETAIVSWQPPRSLSVISPRNPSWVGGRDCEEKSASCKDARFLASLENLAMPARASVTDTGPKTSNCRVTRDYISSCNARAFSPKASATAG